MTPLVLPIATADLSRRIAAHWSGERGVARCAGVDPKKIRIEVMPDLSLILLGPPEPPTDRQASPLALRFLLDALEDEGLAVDRESGRVLGWAAVRLLDWREACDLNVVPDAATGLVAIVSLDITDPRRSAYFDAVLAARLARRAPVGVDAKGEGALRRWMATYGGGVR